MKITLGQVVTIVIVLSCMYSSIFGFIIPFINGTTSEYLNKPSEVCGVIISSLMVILLFLYLLFLLKENWDRGFNINLNFKKQNKEE